MITALFNLLILFFILGLFWFATDWIGAKFGLPDKARNVVKGLIALVALIFVINFLLTLSGKEEAGFFSQPTFIRSR